jgi:hypothetical protein
MLFWFVDSGWMRDAEPRLKPMRGGARREPGPKLLKAVPRSTAMILISLAAAGAASFFGYTSSRGFVRRRLRGVDAVQKGGAPIVAGVAATVAAAPVVGILPFVGAGVAVAFGLAVGTGVSHGVHDIRERRTSP